MSQNVADAVYARWNAAGLNTTIDELWHGETAPEGDTLPRAVYRITTARDGLSRGSMFHNGRLTIQTWGDTITLAQGYIDAIKPLFHNADDAATDPLVMTGGTIQSCLYVDSSAFQEEDDVYQGVILFDIQWQEANTVPS